MQIASSIAMVTGAGSGIGEAVVRELVRREAKLVVLIDRSEQVEKVAAEINASASRHVAEAFVGDTTDGAFREAVFSKVCQMYGAPRILVPAAGILRDGLAVKTNKASGDVELYPQSLFEQVLQVNLVAPTYWALDLIAKVAIDRKSRGLGSWKPTEPVEGAIVFIGSISSRGNRGQISYAASKAGLRGVASTVAKEAIYFGIRSAIVHPGYVDTPMLRSMGEEMIAKHVAPSVPLGRLLRPAEIADAVCGLIANDATGGELWVEGG